MSKAIVPSRPDRSSTAAGLGLSARLLILTVGFVMLAEVSVFVPSIAQFRVDFLREKLVEAHLVLTALDASRGPIDSDLRDRLLDQTGLLGMTEYRPNMPPRTLGPRMPSYIPMMYDLRMAMRLDLIEDAFAALLGRGSGVIGVTGTSPMDPAVVVDVIFDELPLRRAMRAYSWQILELSVFISVTTAALVYASLQWLAVRPLRRITGHLVAFRDSPEDRTRAIVPGARSDEVGDAETALAEMQHELRLALSRKERLAGVGAAVTKISHDLKNILTTAMLESERLSAHGDEHTRSITAGIVRSLDRAVALAGSTLQFAQGTLLEPRRRPTAIVALVEDVARVLHTAFPSCRVSIDGGRALVSSVDGELVLRALENVVRNAAEAGASEVRLTLRDNPPAVLVSDNGPGFPPRALDNLFVPFAGSARPGGSGLGLPIAREVMRAQNGDVVLEETSSAGTAIAVRLPS